MRRVFAAWVLLCALAPAICGQENPNETRPARDEKELRAWLENMAWHHRYTAVEMQEVLGMPPQEIAAALARWDIRAATRPKRPKDAPLLVLPYPGGRHPRIGFLEGAIRPQRETKLSIFTPWDEASYVVLDCPEAVWSNLGLTYLAHTHIDTIWSKQGITLPRLEWSQSEKGAWVCRRELPNGIAFAVEAMPARDHVALTYKMTNGTKAPLSDLRLQMCAMLKGVKGLDAQTNDNKIFREEFSACRNEAGDRWIIHAWRPIDRTWGNAPCPCLHADPKLPDCPPGETREARGWISFYEGKEIDAELERIRKVWK